MNGNSILLGRVYGIPIKISKTLLILMPVFALMYGRQDFFFGLAIVIGIFTSVALHELGHSLVAMRFGTHVQEIELGILGGAAKMSRIPVRPREEILVALAGPAVSLAIGLFGIFSVSPTVFVVGAINLILCGFNLLPCFPMDGGRVLRAVLSIKKGRVESTRIAVQIGKYFCGLFAIYGLLNLHLILVFIAVYMWQAGQMEYRMILLENQANRFSGFREGQLDIDVSPPPYASGGGNAGSNWADRIRRWFKANP